MNMLCQLPFFKIYFSSSKFIFVSDASYMFSKVLSHMTTYLLAMYREDDIDVYVDYGLSPKWTSLMSSPHAGAAHSLVSISVVIPSLSPPRSRRATLSYITSVSISSFSVCSFLPLNMARVHHFFPS